MTFHIITLFPRAFDSYLGESILKRAIEDKKIQVKFYNPRDFTRDKRLRIDRKPYGGGPGMVIQALPVIRAVEKAYANVLKNNRIENRTLRMKDKGLRIVWLTPGGRQFSNETGIKYAKANDIIIICGRYEGIDARVKKVLNTTRMMRIGERMTRITLEEISVGPYVLTGGELPAMILIDAIARQVKGVLGNEQSREETRIASSEVYTRPEVFSYRGKKYRVPKVLLSGNHAKITAWRQKKKKATQEPS